MSEPLGVKSEVLAPQATGSVAVGPPTSIGPPAVYALYRGVTGSVNGHFCRIWVEFTAVELCWARRDQPARPSNRVSLLHLSGCECVAGEEVEGRLDIHCLSTFLPAAVKRGPTSGLAMTSPRGDGERRAILQVTAPARELEDFGEALGRLIKSRDEDGPTVLEFIRRRLFQYL